jgi:hypothetical protein
MPRPRATQTSSSRISRQNRRAAGSSGTERSRLATARAPVAEASGGGTNERIDDPSPTVTCASHQSADTTAIPAVT